jgi:DNA-binding XRE family transcriptional regulator
MTHIILVEQSLCVPSTGLPLRIARVFGSKIEDVFRDVE